MQFVCRMINCLMTHAVLAIIQQCNGDDLKKKILGHKHFVFLAALSTLLSSKSMETVYCVPRVYGHKHRLKLEKNCV